MSVCLVDGTYQVCRSVYSNASHLTSTNGAPTGGTFVFLKILYSMRELGKCIVAFDAGRAKYRTDLYPTYKKRSRPRDEIEEANRNKMFEFTYSTLKRLLPKMGIPIVQMAGQEADDVLFRLAEFYEQRGDEKVYVASDDADYLQFINLGTTVHRPMKNDFWNKERFIQEMDFDPTYFTLYKSIIGDGSDHIDGVKGIGEKTATKIIKELKEPTPLALWTWASGGKKSIQKKVKTNFALIKRNMLLIDLTKAPLCRKEVVAELMEAEKVTEVDPEFVKQQFKKLEFNSLGDWLAYLQS